MGDQDHEERAEQTRDPFTGETPDNDLPDVEDVGTDEQPDEPGVAGTPEDWGGGSGKERPGGAGETPSTPGGLDGPSTGQGGG